MRALILTELAGPRALRFTDADEPDPAGRVLVEVRAAGLIYPDLLMSYGRYQLKIPPPFVPGSEIADRKSTRLNSSHPSKSRMPSSA